MDKPISVLQRKQGRPATGIDPLLNFRSPPTLTAELDAWIAAQPDPRPTRSEAIRRLLAKALEKPSVAWTIAVEDLNASNDE
jgi:hypothetical protein